LEGDTGDTPHEKNGRLSKVGRREAEPLLGNIEKEMFQPQCRAMGGRANRIQRLNLQQDRNLNRNGEKDKLKDRDYMGKRHTKVVLKNGGLHYRCTPRR